MNNNVNSYQEYLNSISFDAQRMSILQPQTGVKLQSIFYNNKQYIRSTSDSHQDLRVLIFSLLIKLYSGTMKIHRQWQQKFKKIIYNSNLQNITLQKGLLKQQLHKIVYQNLCQLTSIQQNIDKMLAIINNSPFFDEILMSSIKNYFQVKKCESINFWQSILSQYFDIMILIKDKDKNQKYENENEIGQDVIQIQQQNNTLLFQYKNRHNPLYLTKQKQKQESQGSLVQNSFGKFYTDDKMSIPISCQSIQSPTFGKQNVNFQNIRLSCSKQGSSLQGIELSPMSSRKSRNLNKRPSSSLWAIFCCGD